MDNLVSSILNRGLAEPIIVSADGFILSGHRRHHACRRLGWTHVPVRRSDIWRCSERRVPQGAERVQPAASQDTREFVAGSVAPRQLPVNTYEALRKRHDAGLIVDAEFMQVDRDKGITPISERRRPFLEAVLRVIENLRDFWPLSIRQIHYNLLPDPPLKQTPKRSKFDAEHYRYANDKASYDVLVDLLASALTTGRCR